MRRLLFWYLPIATAAVFGAIFAYGFVSFVRGDIGERVSAPPAAPSTRSSAAAGVTPIILGDSLARGAGDQSGLGIGGRLDAELQSRRIRTTRATVNVGISGARTADLELQLAKPGVRRLLAESNLIVISIGGNDLWGGEGMRNGVPPNPEEVMGATLDRVEAIVRDIRSVNAGARIFFVGLYNPFAATEQGKQLTSLVNRWNGDVLARFGSDPNFVVVQTANLFTHRDRLAADRFHPGGEAYGLIARRIADAL